LQFLEFCHLALGGLDLPLLAIEARKSEVRLGSKVTRLLDFNYLDPGLLGGVRISVERGGLS
jgi:hypothetical protein